MAYNLLQLTTDQCISHSRNVRSAEWRQNYSPCRYSIPPLHYCSPAHLHPDPSWWQRHPGVAVPVRWRHGIQWLAAASTPAAWFRCVGECTVSCSFLAMSRCRHVCYLPAYETQCWVVFLHIYSRSFADTWKVKYYKRQSRKVCTYFVTFNSDSSSPEYCSIRAFLNLKD